MLLAIALAACTCLPASPSFAEASGEAGPPAGVQGGSARDAGGPLPGAGAALQASSARAAAVSLQAADVDLNAAWAAQEKGLEAPFTITEGGAYHLSADLSANSSLVVNAPGESVELDFNGYKLSLTGRDESDNGVRAQTMVCVEAASSVTLNGASASGSSTLTNGGSIAIWGVYSNAQGCSLHLNDMRIDLTPDSDALRTLHSHCVRLASGSLDMTRCTVVMGMGGQALRDSSDIECLEPPSAVYAKDGTSSVVLDDCNVEGAGTSALSLTDISDATAAGNAYALYSLAGETTVKGGTYRATSLLGNATCLYASNLDIASGPVKLEAGAAQVATGVLSSQAGGATLGAPVQFSVPGEYAGHAAYVCALRASTQDAFVFGKCAPSSSGGGYPLLALTDGQVSNANPDGFVIGSFSGAADDSAKGAVLASLTDALGDSGCCAVVYADSSRSRVKFAFDSNRAPAEVQGVRYATIASALDALAKNPSGTLKVLKDLDAVRVSNVTDGTVDLNGKAIRSLTYDAAGSGAGLVVRNGAITATETAVMHASPAPLTLEGVSVRVDAVDSNACGVSAAASSGPLTVTGSTIDVRASRISSTQAFTAIGVDVAAAGPVVSIGGTTVSSRALARKIESTGVRSKVSAKIADSAVSASSAGSTTRAVEAGGNLEAIGSSFGAYTSSLSGEACAVKMSDAEPVAANVSLTACSFKVESALADVSSSNYACLLGSPSELGAVVPSGTLTLAGKSSFESVGGVHVGLNVGSMRLAADFELDGQGAGGFVVSQSEGAGAAGILVDSAMAEARMGELADCFKAKEGSFYDGWRLVADAASHRLVWRPSADSSSAGVVSVEHKGTSTAYATFKQALAAAQSGDTVKVLQSFAESGAFTVDEDDLALDLNGNTLTVRAGSRAAAGDDGTGAALRFTGAGSLSVRNGTLALQAGAPAKGDYRGISVSGGGTLAVADGAKVSVDFAGDPDSASQDEVLLRGIAVLKGSLVLDGQLGVSGARRDAGFGASGAYGVFVQPGSSDAARVKLGGRASVEVGNQAAPRSSGNAHYPGLGTANARTTLKGLREITVDPQNDPEFYDDLVQEFRASAVFDDPYDTTLRESFGARVYYAQAMAIYRDGAWYDGLPLWAYSDVVAEADVGKLSSIVPAHVFVSASYDTLPQAFGIATGAAASGKAELSIAGSVAAACAHGDACALNAAGPQGGGVSWECKAASLSATADEEVHPLAHGGFDLRNYIAFADGSQTRKVAYGDAANAEVVRYQPASARDVIVGEGVSFTFAGPAGFALSGTDVAAVQGGPFSVGKGFALAAGSGKCSVASGTGATTADLTFAKGASGVQAALFEDAYGMYLPKAVAGGAAWGAAIGKVVTFQVGDAVVARVVNPNGAIDLKGPSAKAVRAGDQYQDHELVGWSSSPDEHATGGYVAADATVSPEASAVYYAVYRTSTASIPVAFSGAFDASGTRKADTALEVKHGQSVKDAIAGSSDKALSVPAAQDYTDKVTGVSYRFAGWSPDLDSASGFPAIYDAKHIGGYEPTYAVEGAASPAGIVVQAVYLPVRDDQHLVIFAVDDRVYPAVVEDGVHPHFGMVSAATSSYVIPSKLVAETGKSYRFAGWFVDANGDGRRASSEQGYRSILPQATSDCSYTADWTSEWATFSLALYVMFYDTETSSYRSDVAQTVRATCDMSVQAAADSLAPIGSQVGTGGKVYTLQGWSPRKSDVEPVYDAENPLPALSSGNGIPSSAAKAYYGVYSVADHEVSVAFYDGQAKLGEATVFASNTTVDAAFAKTGSPVPADKSEELSFLGWATADGAESALDGTSTKIEDIVESTATSVSLYAVYGILPSYTVRLRDVSSRKVLYAISVKRGRTLNSVIEQAKLNVKAPAQSGKYFSGWRTAAGQRYDFDSPVSGSATLYTSYNDIIVESKASDVSAVVTSASSKLERAAGVKFTIVPRKTADTPLRYATAENSYSIMKSYDIRLVATDEQGAETVVTGEFGTAKLTVDVGKSYKDAAVRGFWLGAEKGSTTVMNSSKKSVGKSGDITLNIGNYEVGDADEGGNLAIGYIEGGNARNKLSLNMKRLGLNSRSNLGSLGTRGLAARATGLLAGNSAGGLKANAAGLGAAANAVPKADVGGPGVSGGADGGVAEGEGAGDGWDSNAAVLIGIGLALLALVVWGAWRLLVARQRDSESAVEVPSLADVYGGGIRF